MDADLTWIIFLAIPILLAFIFGIIFGKTGILNEDNKKISKWLKYAIGVVVFGVLSILGTAFSASFNGVLLNTRDFPPIAGGLWFGPVIGIGAGVIGAAYRVTAGGVTVIPCTIATLLAGILAAVVYIWFKKTGKQMTILVTVLTAVVLELIHLLLVTLLVSDGLSIACGPAGIGTLVSAVAAVFVFSLAYRISSKKA